MKTQEMRDRAYRIATANLTTAIMSEEEFTDCEDLRDHAWAVFEYHPEPEYRAIVIDLADEIITALKECNRKKRRN